MSTTPLWPQAKDLVERTNRSILKELKIAYEVVRDNDAEHEMRMKAYADMNASESKVELGDTVVLKHENRCQLDPNFKPERFTVTGLDGSCVC